jgi:protein-S-isoprenylcysteine O-methyltransferase Ste14
MAIERGLTRGSVILFYLLIGLEIVIMVSPFAAYFYAVYGPILNFLYGFRATAWLTGFFMPHAVISTSTLLNFLNGIGRTIFFLGIVLFLIGAFQIYTARFRRKGVVTGFLYRRIRHPQYLFLAIAGLGLLLFWPRFLILVLYVTMLFVYYLLARYEERQMLEEHGESYGRYMNRTAMFLPGEPGRRVFAPLFGWIKPKSWALAVCYGTTLVMSLAVAFGLYRYTISHTSIAHFPERETTAISIYPQSGKSLQDVLDVAYQDSQVNSLIDGFREEGHRGFLVHVMPGDYMMERLFARPSEGEMHPMRRFSWRGLIGFVFPFLGRHGEEVMMGMREDGAVRLIFSQLTWPDGRYAPGDRAMDFSVKHLPLLRVDIDLTKGVVEAVERTPKRNFWGQMPMPLF